MIDTIHDRRMHSLLTMVESFILALLLEGVFGNWMEGCPRWGAFRFGLGMLQSGTTTPVYCTAPAQRAVGLRDT